MVLSTDFEDLYDAIRNKDTNTIENFASELLMKSISTFDSSESFYHVFFLSLLHNMPKYSVRSNREEGLGRPDIVLYPMRPKDPAYIFEIKTRDKFNEMDSGFEEAFTQIRDRKYEEGILSDGYAAVVSYGVCFCRKSCVVGTDSRYKQVLIQEHGEKSHMQ
ncbi:MAG: PD-(D/E)XK nuclease domain-containing protein [Lachnospiraceae bacterium]|nr:PD-(D/E)XK nuclease domain-containing protein [Lachnospiraceae bacterium]